MVSKFHSYEGYPLSTVIYPIRVMAKLGIKSLFSTLLSSSPYRTRSFNYSQ